MSKRARFKGKRFAARMLVVTTVFLLALLANALVASAAPTTVLSTVPSAPNGDAGWYKTAPSIYLWAMGENTTYSPSAVTFYRWDTSATPEGWQIYTGPIVAPEGGHYFEYYSTDDSGTEPVQARTLLIDTIAPGNPVVKNGSHLVGVWSNNPIINLALLQPSDLGSGPEGFSVLWSQSSLDEPDFTKDLENIPTTFDSPVLNTGDWYLHYRTKDYAGNWSGSLTAGPYKIDRLIPTNPTASSPSHTVGGSSGDNTIDMNFTGAADSVSGVDGFSIQWTQATTTTPDTIKDAEENVASTTSPALAAGSWYFHLRTKDNAGNWSAPIHSGPYTITAPDTTPPVTTLTSTRTSVTLTRNEPGTTYFKWDAGAWQVYTGPIAILKGTHTLYYYSVDLAGNVETTKSKVLKK